MAKMMTVLPLLAILGCSGGKDGVSLVGSGAEGKGSGAWDSSPFGANDGDTTTNDPPLLVLCIQACARVHAADCGGAPIAETDSCELTCASEIQSVTPTCMDELAGVYACTLDATVSCSPDIAETPIVGGCDDAESSLVDCTQPGAGGDCAVVPDPGSICANFGLSTFIVCANGASPGDGCVEVGPSEFCCG